jgi:hypothetical protein
MVVGTAAVAPLAVVLSGCSGSDIRGRLDSTTDRLEAPRSTPPAPPNPDQPLVDSTASAIGGLVDALEPVRAEDPAIPGLIALHQAHLKRLGRASRPAAAVSLDGSRLMADVRSHETALAGMLAKQAGAAHDGDLARLLAAMSASVSQRVAVMAS